MASNSIVSTPFDDPIADLKTGKVNSFPWILFLNRLAEGDVGTEWVPTFTSLGSTGTPTFTGMYYRISNRLVYWRVKITPATDTTSTAGTTYINNFPLVISQDGQCLASSGVAGSATAGAVVASSSRIYTPGWAAIAVPVTITGTIEAR